MKHHKLLFLFIFLGLLAGYKTAFAAFEPITPAGMYPDDFVIGDLVKLAGNDALYYLGADGKRYSFPNDKTYFTWYADFTKTKIIGAAQLASIQLGGSVTYRPGMKMIKIQSLPTVYAVSSGGVLHAIPDEATAGALYGTNWNLHIDDVSDAFWVLYKIGAPLAQASDYSPATELAAVETITQDRGLEITSAYKRFTLPTSQGSFTVSVTELNRKNFTMVTDTAYLTDCPGNCAAKSLQDYLTENAGSMAIHGTYFCPPDYADCASKINSFDWPVYNSADDVMINESRLRFHDGPLVATDANGQYYYFHRAKDFGSSVADFEARNHTTLGSAISNYPSLVESGQVVVFGETMDTNQQTVKGSRGGIGFNDQYVILVVASGATVPDLAYIMQALGADNAMNLDGGGSVAMMYDNSYVVGPGRLLPNAIIFQSK